VKRKKQTAFTVASGPAQNNFPQIAVEIFLTGALSSRVLVLVSRRPLTLMFRSLANCQTVGVTFTSNSLAWMWFRDEKKGWRTFLHVESCRQATYLKDFSAQRRADIIHKFIFHKFKAVFDEWDLLNDRITKEFLRADFNLE
jgi:hypothetical protein